MSKHTLHEYQEQDVEEILAELEESHGYIAAHDGGMGKTTIGSEIILRGIERSGWSRVLLIALPDTHKAWVDRITAQADGAPALPIRVMDGSASGKTSLEHFMGRVPGIYIAGSKFLQEKDWESRRKLDDSGRPIRKYDKKTDEPVFKERAAAAWTTRRIIERIVDESGKKAKIVHEVEQVSRAGMIGPAVEPVFETGTVRKHFFDRFARKPLDAILFDEVQEIANRKSKGRQTILSIKAENRVALSATWFRTKVENQWSIARWVWPGTRPDGEPYVETNYSRWAAKWLQMEDVTSKSGRPLEGQFGTVKRVVGEKAPGAFAASLPGYIRRESPDRAPDPLLLYVDPMPEQARQMRELQDDLMSWVMNWRGEEVPLVTDMPIVLRTRLKQVCIASLSVEGSYPAEKVVMHPDAQSAKLAPLRWLLEERWKGEPAMIYTDSKIGAHFIAERMRRSGASVQVRSGDMSKKAREEQKQAFIAGEFQYLVAVIAATSTGIDGLQTHCNKLAWISHVDGDPTLNDQALWRLFRQGRIITDPSHPSGGFEHARILMRNSVDVESLQATLNAAWMQRQALNAGQPAA